MGSIRFIIFAIVIWLVWRMITKFIAEQKANKSVPKSKKKKLAGEKMVQCHYCSTHLPKNTATSYSGKWFCDNNHRTAYVKENES